VTLRFCASRPAQLAIVAQHMFGHDFAQMHPPSTHPTFESVAARAAPAIFVLLWSTGFIGTKYVLASAEPLTYLTVRMIFVVLLMGVIAAIWRPQWPDRAGVLHSAIAGRWHGGRDFSFGSRRIVGADSRTAADPDVDVGEPLAW
jgi:hypothetical protein